MPARRAAAWILGAALDATLGVRREPQARADGASRSAGLERASH